jgi:two-component system LytT family sensor kinase
MFRTKYRYAFILLLAGYSFFNILFFVGDKLFDFPLPSSLLFATLLLTVLIIWELNRFTEKKLAVLQLAMNQKVHPLIILFVISQVNAMLAALVGLAVVYAFVGNEVAWSADHYKLIVAFSFRVNLFLNCLNAIWYFMDKSKRAEVRAERFEKVSIEAQFEALRNQINPHFLFNCLNALSNLVYKDADTSAKFIGQLSSVYRYLLYNQEKKIVSLQEELDFIDSYLYLLKIRFGENVFIEKNIRTDVDNLHIAPATLQMLIENAIKHNIVSNKAPLKIQIVSLNGSISVTNNLQEKRIKEPSAYIGLKNIVKRYEFLSDKPVEIKKTENEFTVKVPLVRVDPI